MSYCGCHNCKINGERNLHEDFELYCSTREEETKSVFLNILRNNFYFTELNEMEEMFLELESNPTKVVKAINEYAPKFDAHLYWTNGARLDPEHWMGF